MQKRGENQMFGDDLCSQHLVKRSQSEMIETGQRLLIDLHDDYLESIFKWLDLDDLLTMCKVHDRFKRPVNSIFVRKYAKKWVKITSKYGQFPIDTSSEYTIEKPQNILFLRYFGHSISKLSIACNPTDFKEYSALEECILKYCDKLKELKLKYCRKGIFDTIEMPFNELEVLSFAFGYLGHNISQVNKWFPKLRSLTIFEATVADKLCLVKTLPLSMEHLDVKTGWAIETFSRDDIQDAILLNPQLRSICLDDGTNTLTLR